MKKVNYKLKGKIAEVGMTQTEFAKLLGISYQSFNSKINGKTPFTQSEINKILNILKDRDIEVTYEDIF